MNFQMREVREINIREKGRERKEGKEGERQVGGRESMREKEVGDKQSEAIIRECMPVMKVLHNIFQKATILLIFDKDCSKSKAIAERR